jgi:transposase
MAERVDLRTLTVDELFIVRKQVVRLKRMGKSGAEIYKMTGVTGEAASRIWSAYRKGGIESIRPKKAGRKKGEQTILTPEQAKEIQEIIIDKTPDQYKMRFMLWTRQAISGLVKQLYGKELSLRCVTNYLKRWGFTCQRPTKKSYFVDNVKVDRFMKEEYPVIAKRAKAEKAEIYWGDETGIDNLEHYQRGFAPKGQPPVIRVESKRERVNMMSAINNQGKIRFMMFDENMNQHKLIEFMRRMITDVPQKVFFILDNLRVHHGKKVKAWLAKHKDRIEVFYLPPYSPELNPDEYFNHALKREVHSGLNPRNKADIRHKAQSFVRRLQHNAEKVNVFFKHHKLLYLNCDV